MPPVISDVACAKLPAESRQGFADRSGRVTAHSEVGRTNVTWTDNALIRPISAHFRSRVQVVFGGSPMTLLSH
jgi:hypothetical protein